MQRSPVRLAAADVVRAHQRRHPADPGCCCSWRPTPGGPGWGEHVTERLDSAGLLVGDLRPDALATGAAAATAGADQRGSATVLLTAALTAVLTAAALAAWAHR